MARGISPHPAKRRTPRMPHFLANFLARHSYSNESERTQSSVFFNHSAVADLEQPQRPRRSYTATLASAAPGSSCNRFLQRQLDRRSSISGAQEQLFEYHCDRYSRGSVRLLDSFGLIVAARLSDSSEWEGTLPRISSLPPLASALQCRAWQLQVGLRGRRRLPQGGINTDGGRTITPRTRGYRPLACNGGRALRRALGIGVPHVGLESYILARYLSLTLQAPTCSGPFSLSSISAPDR